jgi:hypothetical protein
MLEQLLHRQRPDAAQLEQPDLLALTAPADHRLANGAAGGTAGDQDELGLDYAERGSRTTTAVCRGRRAA